MIAPSEREGTRADKDHFEITEQQSESSILEGVDESEAELMASTTSTQDVVEIASREASATKSDQEENLLTPAETVSAIIEEEATESVSVEMALMKGNGEGKEIACAESGKDVSEESLCPTTEDGVATEGSASSAVDIAESEPRRDEECVAVEVERSWADVCRGGSRSQSEPDADVEYSWADLCKDMDFPVLGSESKKPVQQTPKAPAEDAAVQSKSPNVCVDGDDTPVNNPQGDDTPVNNAQDKLLSGDVEVCQNDSTENVNMSDKMETNLSVYLGKESTAGRDAIQVKSPTIVVEDEVLISPEMRLSSDGDDSAALIMESRKPGVYLEPDDSTEDETDTPTEDDAELYTEVSVGFGPQSLTHLVDRVVDRSMQIDDSEDTATEDESQRALTSRSDVPRSKSVDAFVDCCEGEDTPTEDSTSRLRALSCGKDVPRSLSVGAVVLIPSDASSDELGDMDDERLRRGSAGFRRRKKDVSQESHVVLERINTSRRRRKPQSLTEEQNELLGMRRMIMNGLVEPERSYVDILRVLVQVGMHKGVCVRSCVSVHVCVCACVCVHVCVSKKDER